jgi:hypothetical protein
MLGRFKLSNLQELKEMKANLWETKNLGIIRLIRKQMTTGRGAWRQVPALAMQRHLTSRFKECSLIHAFRFFT